MLSFAPRSASALSYTSLAESEHFRTCLATLDSETLVSEPRHRIRLAGSQ
jgi:hypothetical protein